jgi:hypothetical protein
MGEMITIEGNNIRNQLQMEGTIIVPPILTGNSPEIPNVRVSVAGATPVIRWFVRRK